MDKGDAYAQFREDTTHDGTGIGIAHLDTGYDPNHQTRPLRLYDVGLQRDFINEPAANGPAGADRPTPTLPKSTGHGTATIAILAGQSGGTLTEPVGAATGATVLPLRVANWVVILWTSSVAQAFDYVLSLTPDVTKPRIDVLSMSMGGLASQVWATTVNALYDEGVFMVTSSGDNYSGFPTLNLVYPARFRRVVAACGIMWNFAPYVTPNPFIMSGNFGPPSRMNTALTGYTPHVPQAVFEKPSTVNEDFGGTSSATPQIAAAAARWMQQYQTGLDALPEPWMRVEATRNALFKSANNRGDFEHFGNGAFRVSDALSIDVPSSLTLTKQPEDDVSFPLLTILLGRDPPLPSGIRQMLELELLQLSQSTLIEQVLPDPDNFEPTPAATRDLLQAFLKHPNISRTLRAILSESRVL